MTMKFTILFALVAAATAEPIPRLNPLSPTGRIVGGVATSIEQVPYQASVNIFGSHFCGGSIISTNWVLTAAHCMIYPSNWYTVRTGTAIGGSGGTVSAIAAIINHEGYDTNAWGIPSHDIALVQLRSALTLGSTQAIIPLYSTGQQAVAGSPAVITGWGALSEGGSAPTVLQTVTIPIVSKAACNSAYSMWGGIPADQICAAVPQGGLDSCQGDSGGPLAINGRLAGVVSWGNGCARPGFPGVYAEVAAYRTWITANAGI